jgi:L,D-peptidoglycan transpeptidase YkuD (ErfK/YbiS/YcfS/YnhG family)
MNPAPFKPSRWRCRARGSRRLAPALGALKRIVVRAKPGAPARGVLFAGPLVLPCALGRGGIRHAKRESDGATPAGRFALGAARFRPDRTQRPATLLKARPLRPGDGWCDEVGDRNYNRPVPHPYPVSHERLWRDDGLYDILIEIGCNVRPRVQGGGSAIFLHIARPGLTPTEGCVALSRRDLARLLPRLGPRTVLVVE